MKSIVKKVSIGLLAVVVLLPLYGVLIEPHLIDVEEEMAVIPGLPPAWEGKRVAAIGDMQVGMWLANTRTIRRIVDRLVEEQPEVVLLLGDSDRHHGAAQSGRAAGTTGKWDGRK